VGSSGARTTSPAPKLSANRAIAASERLNMGWESPRRSWPLFGAFAHPLAELEVENHKAELQRWGLGSARPLNTFRARPSMMGRYDAYP
jgi:hypothetical protein